MTDLLAVLEPHMQAQVADAVRQWPPDFEAPHGRLHVSGILKLPGHESAAPASQDQAAVYAAARKVREALYRQAEDAIAAAQEAGWAICDHPEISVSGQLDRDPGTGIVTPVTEGRVTLWLRIPSPGVSCCT